MMNAETDTVRETEIEQYLTDQAAKLFGAGSYKFVCPGETGMPDRILVIPHSHHPVRPGITVFVEVKRPGKEPTGLQARKLKDLQKKGQYAYWVSSKMEVDELMVSIQLVLKAL